MGRVSRGHYLHKYKIVLFFESAVTRCQFHMVTMDLYKDVSLAVCK